MTDMPMGHVALKVAETDRLRRVSVSRLPEQVAYLYDYVNYAHPFREGNGRSTREFFDQLLAERGACLAWDRTDLHTLYQNGSAHLVFGMSSRSGRE